MNERQKRFVKLLLETNEYLPVKYYADILNISEKSIRRDIESINYYMKKYNGTIDKKTGIGIMLDIDSKNKIRFMHDLEMMFLSTSNKINDASERVNEIKLYLLLCSPNIFTLNELSKKFYISKSTIHEYLGIIEQDLKEYEITIDKSMSGTRIIGSEFHIRKAIIEQFKHYFNKYDLLENDFDIKLIANSFDFLQDVFINDLYTVRIEQLFKSINESIDRKLTIHEMKWIKISLAIQIYRLKMNCMINKEKQERILLMQYESKLSKICIKFITNILKNDITIEEISFVNWILSNINLNNTTKLSSKRIENITESFTSDFIDAFSAITGLSLRNKEKFYENISQHIFFMLLRVNNGQRFQNPILEKMRNEYRAMEKVCTIICWLLCQKYKLNTINTDEISYLMAYIQGEILDLESKLNCIVIYDSLNSLRSFFKVQLNRRFPNLTINFAEHFEKNYLKEYDLMLDTISKKEDKGICNYINISPMLLNEELDSIDDVIVDIISNKKDYYRELIRITNDLNDIGVSIELEFDSNRIVENCETLLKIESVFAHSYVYCYQEIDKNVCFISFDDENKIKQVSFLMNNWDYMLFSAKLVYLIENCPLQILEKFRKYILDEWRKV